MCGQRWKYRGAAPWELTSLLFLKFLRVCTAARVPPSRAVCFQAPGGARVLGSPGRNLHPQTRLPHRRLPASAPDI